MINKTIKIIMLLGCGFVPFKPFVPFGCKDLVAQCVCDNEGECSFQWICVR